MFVSTICCCSALLFSYYIILEYQFLLYLVNLVYIFTFIFILILYIAFLILILCAIFPLYVTTHPFMHPSLFGMYDNLPKIVPNQQMSYVFYFSTLSNKCVLFLTLYVTYYHSDINKLLVYLAFYYYTYFAIL